MPPTDTHRKRIKAPPLTVAALAMALSLGSQARAQDAEPADQGLAYSQCMRKNGFPDFPDPDSEGRILLQQRLDSRSAPAFQAAGEACRDLAPPGWAAERPDSERMEQLLGFAQCVRDEGVPDFPDPNAEGGFDFAGMDIDIADSPTMRAAMETCRQAEGVTVGFGG